MVTEATPRQGKEDARPRVQMTPSEIRIVLGLTWEKIIGYDSPEKVPWKLAQTFARMRYLAACYPERPPKAPG